MVVDYEAGILKICDLGSAKKLVRNEKSVSYVSRTIGRRQLGGDLFRFARGTIGQ